MNFSLIPLEAIQIAQPCRADWNNMTGDERARFCGSCHKNVYDISQLTRAEAHQLIAEREGDVCLRLHRRPDGTVITSDCPVGIAATARPLWWGVAALMALIGSGLSGCAASGEQTQTAMQTVAQTLETPQPTPIQVERPTMELGKIKSVPIANNITNGPAPDVSHAGVTMGAPMMPQPTPTNAPLLGKAMATYATTGEPTMR